MRDAPELHRDAAAEAPGPPLSRQLAAVDLQHRDAALDVSALAICEAIEWKIPPLSIPSVNVRAPPPPPKKSVMRADERLAGRFGRDDRAVDAGRPVGLRLVAGSAPRQSIIFAKALATTSCVESVAIIERHAHPGGADARC